MHRQSKIVPALLFSAVLVLLMLVEWLRRIPFANHAINVLQANLLDLILLKSTQIPVVIILVVYLAVFLAISVRNQRGNGVIGSGSSSNTANRSKIGLIAFSVVACFKAWISPEDSGSIIGLQMGIDQSTNGVVLLTGLTIVSVGEWFLNDEESGRVRTIALMIIPLFLASTCFLHPAIPHEYEYLNAVVRWTGLWVNPNIYGMLMGLGAILAAGQALRASRFRVQIWATEVQSPRSKAQSLFVGLWFLTGVVCVTGLFRSYSRGAWAATGFGIVYLIGQASGQRSAGSSWQAWLHRNWISMFAILLSVVVLNFWQFRFTEWKPARRVFSIANINDFSWRNRVTAWDGAIRMMGNQPFFGYGWGEAECIYEEKYLPPQMENGMAIQMNDYFTIGISAGVPALICFLVYVGMSLRQPRRHINTYQSNLNSGLWALDWPKNVCRAGAIELLVGFWFDGGLFKLATGPVFWALLELGRVGSNSHKIPQIERVTTKEYEEPEGKVASSKSRVPKNAPVSKTIDQGELGARSDTDYHCSLMERWLKRVAWVVGTIALIETMVLVGAPFLQVNRVSLAIARHWLIAPKAVEDFDFLAAMMVPSDNQQQFHGNAPGHEAAGPMQLRVLLQNASLANYNRQLINWSLDDEVYRDYVLWPDVHNAEGGMKNAEGQKPPNREIVAPTGLGNLNWRRLLWEYFYPHIRHESSPEEVAKIVVRHLRERVTISNITNPSHNVSLIWQRQITDEVGFEIIYVAALRSVGVPARLDVNERAEFYNRDQWVVAQNLR